MNSFQKGFMFILLCIVFLVSGVQADTKRLILAIAEFENYSQNSSVVFLQKGIPDVLINSLNLLEGISIVERSAFNKIMKELELGMTGLMNDVTVQKVGEMLQANVMIVGGYQYNELYNTIRLTARVVEVETGLMMDSESVFGSFDTVDDLELELGDLLNDFFKEEYGFTERAERVVSRSHGKKKIVNAGTGNEDFQKDRWAIGVKTGTLWFFEFIPALYGSLQFPYKYIIKNQDVYNGIEFLGADAWGTPWFFLNYYAETYYWTIFYTSVSTGIAVVGDYFLFSAGAGTGASIKIGGLGINAGLTIYGMQPFSELGTSNYWITFFPYAGISFAF